MLQHALMFALGLTILVVGADLMVRGASRLAVSFGVSPLVVGLTVMPEHPPAWIAGGLQKLADALLPLVMLAVGLTIRLKLPRDEVKPLAVGLSLRLLVMPALALPLSLAFGLQGAMLQANVLESAMPSMITAAALAISHQLAPRLAAALVGYGILLSLVTLPAWAWVLQRWG